MTSFSIVYPQQEGLYYGVERVENGVKEVVGYYKAFETAEAVCGALANEAYRATRQPPEADINAIVSSVRDQARGAQGIDELDEIVDSCMPVYYREMADLLALNPGLGFGHEDDSSAYSIIQSNVWNVLMSEARQAFAEARDE